jgi:hypothetical protein
MNLTYPERGWFYYLSCCDDLLTRLSVTLAYLQELAMQKGPREYPGARYVVRDTGERIDNKRADAFLQYGWIVERHKG